MTSPIRVGPRPLPLHLAAAALTWFGAAKLPLASRALETLSDRDATRTMLAEIGRADPQAIETAIADEARRRFDDFSAAIDRYRRHPSRRTEPEPPSIWSEGKVRLLDYGGDPDAPVVLIVPSLVNRYYILDLCPESSFVGELRSRGLRPVVVDWGMPGPTEARLDVTGYVTERLDGALTAAVLLGAGPVAVVGYCMGGLLALALAARHPPDIAALALLATPWDFHAPEPEPARLAAAALPLMEPLIEPSGTAPVDLLQTLFFALDPFTVIRKFRAFAALAPDDPRASHFVLVEDWLADGVPLAAPVFRECLTGWYGENLPRRGMWRIAGDPVDPARLSLPSLIVVPARDRIVPPPSAAALGAAIPGAVEIRPRTGHIGMVAGRDSRDRVAEPVATWLLSNMHR